MTTSSPEPYACGSSDHVDRRTLLKAAGLSGLCWLTPLATHLARAHERKPTSQHAKSLIVLWLEGGPSQLETFDPHPNTRIAAGSIARKTNVTGIQLGSGLEQLAEQMDKLSLIRSVTSKEGDHERAIYNIKTGFRPDPTLVHPSVGSVICHQLQSDKDTLLDIPHHISILPGQAPGRGGYLGDQFDAFKINDPRDPVPDVRRRVDDTRFERRISDLKKIVEPEFARGRIKRTTDGSTLEAHTTDAALRMMSSEQLKAFEVMRESKQTLGRYGNTPFGRGCLTAVRLIETGVRCVEVTLRGWDSHANNHEVHSERIGILDPAFAAMLEDLEQRDLLDDTIVVCAGEFGRTPTVNPAGGRDHWPHGFSVAIGGGGIRGGHVVGETSPTPKTDKKNRGTDIKDPKTIEDVHATILHALGVDFEVELDTPVGRPMRISDGKIIQDLLLPSA